MTVPRCSAALAALVALACGAPSTATPMLRVGTTGDYAPFSVRDGDSFEGVDIDLAHDLAESLGRNAVFVPTTWRTLLEDLRAGRFDIAMSGITDTPQRRGLASFSEPYYRGHKVAVVRCADLARFTDLASIDRDDVTVLVNAGGTNETFVVGHIHHAQVDTTDDNMAIFDSLERHEGDVMFTDAIEAQVQTTRRQSLCIAGQDQAWSRFAIAILAPQGSPLLPRINHWLRARQADQTIPNIFTEHLQD